MRRADAELEVYTTRPDTLFGATYMVVAPEHPLLGQLAAASRAAEVAAYVEAASKKSDFERTELSSKHKSGVFTGGARALGVEVVGGGGGGGRAHKLVCRAHVLATGATLCWEEGICNGCQRTLP